MIWNKTNSRDLYYLLGRVVYDYKHSTCTYILGRRSTRRPIGYAEGFSILTNVVVVPVRIQTDNGIIFSICVQIRRLRIMQLGVRYRIRKKASSNPASTTFLDIAVHVIYVIRADAVCGSSPASASFRGHWNNTAREVIELSFDIALFAGEFVTLR